jgi:kynurenine formamidase
MDLTYSFDEETIFWPTEVGFKLDVQSFGITEKGFHYAANKFCTAEHGGTHMDAPIHFYD